MRDVSIQNSHAIVRQQFPKEPRFGSEISLEVVMIVEMVMGEVGERRRLDSDAVQAILIETVTGRFDSKMVDAIICNLTQKGVKSDRIRRRETAFDGSRRRVQTKRAERSSDVTERSTRSD